MKIAIDFDGTCVTHEFPLVGQDIGAVPVLKRLVDEDHQLILFTMRSDRDGSHMYLTEAVNWFICNDIELYGIQKDPTQESWTFSPKAYAELYIDDAALGIPLVHSSEGRSYVDWVRVERLLMDRGILSDKNRNR